MEIASRDAVKIVARLIIEGSKNDKVRNFTISLLRDKGIPLYPFSYNAVNAIYEFVNKNVEYVKDIRRIETHYTAEKILENLYGDCDDKVIIAGSMLRTIGMDICICLMDLNNKKSYDHIFLLVLLNGKWVPFDATIQNGFLGKVAPSFYRVKVYYLY